MIRPASSYFLSSDFSTSMVHLVTIPVITPKAASHGAKTTMAAAPAAPQVTGIESKTFPLSSFMIILLTLTSFIISFTFPTKPSPDTLYTALFTPICVPQFEQNLASGETSDLQSVHFTN